MPDKVCYSLNIPDATASAGSGDIFFQISAPTSYQWVALGQGSHMAGSNIFVVYTSADATNVTVSPRLGTGNNMPRHDTSAQISVLEGSGVSNGVMTANIRCGNCNSWQGGSMDFSGSDSSWIHGYKSGSALNSDDVSANIVQHDDASAFNWDLSQARGGNDVNPFVVASATSGSASSSTSAGSATSATAATTPTTSSSPSTTFAQAGFLGLSDEQQNRMILAHGILACITFVALFPIGGIIIRIANFTGLVWIHAAVQILGYMLYIAAFGLGIYIATARSQIADKHPIIGIILFAVLFTQPFTGWLHHRFFKAIKSRSASSYMHIGLGRLAILLGMINGGFGLQLFGASRSAIIAYSVVTGIVGVVYISVIVFGEIKKSKRSTGRTSNYDQGQKDSEMQTLSSRSEDTARAPNNSR